MLITKNFKKDFNSIIGTATARPDGLLIEMRDGYELTGEEIESVFGHVGFVIYRAIQGKDNKLRSQKFKIIEFSLVSK